MKILIACEFSGIVREAFRKKGHNAWSCDLLPSEIYGKHYKIDVFDVIDDGWDMMIAHPPCTRLANSGGRWMNTPPKGKTIGKMWREFNESVEFYNKLRNAPIEKKAIENPVMHRYAIDLLGKINRHIVQPWWFGERAFKATGFELYGLPKLKPTNKLVPPKPGTKEHKKWSFIHRMPPSKDRWKNRSRTFRGIAEAMADQWG